MSKHLPERASPFHHTCVDQFFKLGSRWTSTPPGAGFGGKCSGVLLDEVPAPPRQWFSVLTGMAKLASARLVCTYSFSILTRTNQQ